MGRADEADVRLVGRRLEGHVHGDRVACRLKDPGKAAPAGQSLGALHEALFLRVDRLVRSHAPGQSQTALVDVERHHAAASEDLRPLQREDADGAAAEHGYIPAALIIVAQHAVQRDRGGLKHRRLLIRNGRIVLHRVALGQHDVIREAALLAAADKAVMLAERIISLLAVRALHTGKQRRAGDGVAHLERLHPFADLDHVARELMSQYHRVKVRAVMQHARHIAAADARRAHPHLHRSRQGFRRGKLLVPNILICMQDRRFHGLSSFIRSFKFSYRRRYVRYPAS